MSNLKLHKIQASNTFIQEKLLPRLTFNPGLALAGFRTTRPRTLRLLISLQKVVFQGRVVRKPINANPGLKVNRRNNSSSPIMISTAYSLCSLRLLKLKAEGQTILTENFTENVQK